ncbi:50S ribosomal protein L19 [candidate division WWE3 bacterium CG10_big_fil_rev_8_21_14_0_10_32_10]|uniref:Large ribosomal subunit protein bL19 n=1 Tax=candidate division WWE3 bacterium CG10_big_fil_rev_8_21_14_0_10_32_10 TaxID=1975090 RepID=A0A2H0RAI2_UNCKA|nr:MAG: 50S ribosomal protein L19 [candidate division WWE3 bacterium CG10_big_fil_rev_8_21_14_0_10_32_10]
METLEVTQEVKVENPIKKVEKTEDIVDLNDSFRVGDTVKVFYRIIEAGKERIQPFEGIVIAKKGKGVSKTFTVRRIGTGQIGVERIFPVYSPRISSIEVIRHGSVRRSKLYYLRSKQGRRETKIKEKITSK